MAKQPNLSGFAYRIGYLYDRASAEDKKQIDNILSKYSSEFPLILSGKKMEPLSTPAEAKKAQSFFDKFKK